MNKLEKVRPVTPAIASNRVIISNTVFQDIIKAIDSHVDAINTLIDEVVAIRAEVNSSKSTSNELDSKIELLRNALGSTNASLQALAESIQVLQNL